MNRLWNQCCGSVSSNGGGMRAASGQNAGVQEATGPQARSDAGQLSGRSNAQPDRARHDSAAELQREPSQAGVRRGSAPNFAPPAKEGMTVALADERGDETLFEFLGLVIHQGRRYGFFFPVTEDAPVGSSGEVVVLEVTAQGDDGQPSDFELVEDEAIAAEVYSAFREATKDIYRFA